VPYFIKICQSTGIRPTRKKLMSILKPRDPKMKETNPMITLGHNYEALSYRVATVSVLRSRNYCADNRRDMNRVSETNIKTTQKLKFDL
jgi:hypothetical protein